MYSYYHPFYPSYRSRFNHHFHAQLSAIQHNRILQQKAQLDYYTQVQRQREAASLVAATYQAQIKQRQLRLSDLLIRSRYTAQIQRERLYQAAKQEQLYYQSMARQIELNRQLMLCRQRHYYMSEGKGNADLFTNNYSIDHLKQYQTQNNSKFIQRNNARDKSLQIQKQQQIANQRNISNEYTQKLQHQAGKLTNKDDRSNGKIDEKSKRNEEKLDKIEYKVSNLNQNKEFLQEKKVRDYSLQVKKPKCVSFKNTIIINDNHTQEPNQQSPQALKPLNLNNSKQLSNKKQNQNSKMVPGISLKQNASKRIQNRLKVSQVVYRDSELRNIKHEHNHLFSTFQTEMMLRKELRTRINSEPRVIEKYKIVVQQK